MAAPPAVTARVSSEQMAQLAQQQQQQQQKHAASGGGGGDGSTKTGQTFDRAQPTPDASKESQDKKTL
jgi:hypothetical protein